MFIVCLFVAEDFFVLSMKGVLLWWDLGVTLMFFLFGLQHFVRQIFNSWVCAILLKVIYDVEVTMMCMKLKIKNEIKFSIKYFPSCIKYHKKIS